MKVAEGRIREHLVELGMGAGLEKVANDQSLLLTGVLDSVGMIDLISEIERVYDVTITEEELTPENFETVTAIARFVSSKTSPQRAL